MQMAMQAGQILLGPPRGGVIRRAPSSPSARRVARPAVRLVDGIGTGGLKAPRSAGRVAPHRRRAVATAASAAAAAAGSPAPSRLERIAEVGTLLFPVWALISGALAFFHPPSLAWMTTSQFERGVQLLMLAMGLSLSTDDFRRCARRPAPILLGFVCQYTLLPLLAFGIVRALGLSPALATGLIILGSCPGGQASNVATFVARGDVALSVLMTTASTLAAAVATPALVAALAGQFVPVDAAGLARSTAELVLAPTLAGVAANELAPRAVAAVRPAMPLLALALTVVLCAVPVAQVADVLRVAGGAALLPVFLLHALGYLLGYWLPRALRFDERVSRTVSIETGMQSAAMGYALSRAHFADPLVAIPAACSIVIMVWQGAALAAAWRFVPTGVDGAE